MRQWLCALLAASSFLCAADAAAQAFDPEIQRQFLEGVGSLQAGDYAKAESVFRSLLERTDSPRIRLELARTLFLQKKYPEARALFRGVLLDPAVPWQVRDNVDAYLRQIDEAVGFFKFSLGVFHDTNPQSITAQREFVIGGLRLDFVAPPDSAPATAMRYLAAGLLPLSPQGDLAAYLVGSFQDYSGSSLDRLTVDGGLAATLDAAGRNRLKMGVEAATYASQQLYEFPYVAYQRLLSQSVSHRLAVEARGGYVTFPDYRYLDASYVSVTVSGAHTLTPTAAASGSLVFENSKAYEDPYSYYGVAINPELSWFAGESAVLVKTGFGYAVRRYAAPDPFFGERRLDHRARLDLSVRNKSWRILNINPALVLSYEKNHSTLDFYEYKKAMVSIAAE